MTFEAAINELLKRPDFIAVLPPDRVIYVGQTGAVYDAAKVGRDYPRFNVREFTAVIWEVWTREQWAQKCEALAAELEQRGVTHDNG